MLAAMATLLAFVAVLAVVVVSGHLLGLDASATAVFAGAFESGALHGAVLVLTLTASVQVAVMVLGGFGLILSVRRRTPGPLVLTSGVTVALVLSVYVVKYVVDRARPGVTLVDPEPSFPSGHATTAVVVAGTVLLLLGPGLSRTARRLALVALTGYVGLAGLSRLYLHLHWFSDVLAGWLLGSAIVCGATTIWLRRPAQAGADMLASGGVPDKLAATR